VLNGTTTFTTPMSDEITELYQSLLAQVANVEDISAYFNQQEGRLHVFFPVNELLSYRLSAALTPPQDEQATTRARWSLSTYAGPTCGHYLAGRATMGTIEGLYNVEPWYSERGSRGPGSAELPILWHGDILNPKQTHMFVLYASGAGKVTVQVHDESMRSLGPDIVFELPDKDQALYYGVPLQQQFVRPFRHKYAGLRAKLKIESAKGVRVFGVGVLVLQE
jgi:hypothetical protein